MRNRTERTWIMRVLQLGIYAYNSLIYIRCGSSIPGMGESSLTYDIRNVTGALQHSLPVYTGDSFTWDRAAGA
jgi:hypothetical protein